MTQSNEFPGKPHSSNGPGRIFAPEQSAANSAKVSDGSIPITSHPAVRAARNSWKLTGPDHRSDDVRNTRWRRRHSVGPDRSPALAWDQEISSRNDYIARLHIQHRAAHDALLRPGGPSLLFDELSQMGHVCGS